MSKSNIDYDPKKNPYKKQKGFKRLWFAAGHSFHGFYFAFREESAFRQEMFLAFILLPWPFICEFSKVEQILLISSLLLVLIVELINSGIEATIDRISFDAHSLSKRAKDYGSAAVLLSLLLCAYVWITLFAPILNLK
jgi:diacylglycerol kinase (ATP)